MARVQFTPTLFDKLVADHDPGGAETDAPAAAVVEVSRSGFRQNLGLVPERFGEASMN